MIRRIAILILLIVFIYSCDETIEKRLDYQLLKKDWLLIGISDETIKSIVHDSTNCENDIPYGYLDGEKIELISSMQPEPGEFDDYKLLETWTFSGIDSLRVKRAGDSPASWQCLGNEAIHITYHVFIEHNFNATWVVNDNRLTISLPGKSSNHIFSIDSLTESTLVLHIENEEKALKFINDFKD